MSSYRRSVALLAFLSFFVMALNANAQEKQRGGGRAGVAVVLEELAKLK